MKSIRQRMLNGEKLEECKNCDRDASNSFRYRDWFNVDMYSGKIEEAVCSTNPDGSTDLKPISFDYRVSNQCNFKCRMCGKDYSSSWETESREFGGWSAQKDPWMVLDRRKQIVHFQKNVVEPEFLEAVHSGRLEEIYWVGGEPLFWELHWRVMRDLIENGQAGRVFCRYNTNLSSISYKGTDLVDDILPHIKSYLICASIDGTEVIGEYIRYGLKWKNWLENFKRIMNGPRGKSGVAMDVTITLPGLFSLKELFDLATELEVLVLSKVSQSYGPEDLFSPMVLPHHLLDPVLDDLIAYMKPRVTNLTQCLLENLYDFKAAKSYDQLYPDEHDARFAIGRGNQTAIDLRRVAYTRDQMTLPKILERSPEIYQWWTRPIENSTNAPAEL